MKIIFSEIEAELKKRHQYPYKWYRKQNNLWDGYTNFIYTINTWEGLLNKISETVKERKLVKTELFYYAINRWYNFWSAMAVEQIFRNCPGIIPSQNPKNRTVDFTLNGISFDHKTSVFPKYLKAGQENEKDLIKWLYTNQSSQQRQHFKNRLYILVYNNNREHWKLKTELKFLEKEIKNYITNFKISQLQKFIFTSQNETFSDIIWVNR